MESLEQLAISSVYTLIEENSGISNKSMEMKTMDREIKAVISESIDKAMEQKDLTDRANWALEAVITYYKIKPNEIVDKMLMLSYILGSTLSSIVDDVANYKGKQKLAELQYKDIMEVFGKEQADKWYADIARGKKKPKIIKMKVSEEDSDYIKTKLIPLVAQFEIKINQEQALKKAKK